MLDVRWVCFFIAYGPPCRYSFVIDILVTNLTIDFLANVKSCSHFNLTGNTTSIVPSSYFFTNSKTGVTDRIITAIHSRWLTVWWIILSRTEEPIIGTTREVCLLFRLCEISHSMANSISSLCISQRWTGNRTPRHATSHVQTGDGRKAIPGSPPRPKAYPWYRHWLRDMANRDVYDHPSQP